MLRAFSNFRFALRGIRFVWRSERSFRQEVVGSLVLIAATVALRFSFLETLLVLFALGVVLAAEVLNTVIEEVLDIVEPDHDPRVGKAKDMMAGAVLLAGIGGLMLLVFTAVHHFFP